MIRLGVLGYGAWGRNVARVAATTAGARLVAVGDTNPDQLAKAKARHGDVDLHCNHEELVGRSDIDAVIIATSAPTHPDVALLAAANGNSAAVNGTLNRIAQRRPSQVHHRLARDKTHLAEPGSNPVGPVDTKNLALLARLKLIECGGQRR